MKKIAVFVAFSLFSSVFAAADQAPVGPVIGRAVTWQSVTFISPSGASHTERMVRQRLIVGSEAFDVLSYCLPDAFGYFSNECSLTEVLGYCPMNTAIFSTTSTDGTQIRGTLSSCTDLHAGNCLLMAGHLRPDGRVEVDRLRQVGGCQY